MSDLYPSPEFMEKVRAASEIPTPDPAFIAQLRGQIRRQAINIDRRKSLKEHFTHILRKPAVFAAIVGFIVLVSATLIAPQQVWAAVQKLIGYIPGIGFVQNTDTTLVLSGPVSVTRDGVKVSVVDTVAAEENTRVILRAEGLSGLQELVQAKPPESSGDLRLVQSDGTSVPLKSYSVEYEGLSAVIVQMDFLPLKPGMTQVTLSFSQIPGVPAGFAPENWELPIKLQAGNASGRITTGSNLDIHSQTHNGISLVLAGNAGSDGKTALQLRLTTSDPSTSIEPNWWNQISIHDANGNPVAVIGEPVIGSGHWDEITLETKALEPGQIYTIKLSGPIDIWDGGPKKVNGDWELTFQTPD
jgi:hypothetical protein